MNENIKKVLLTEEQIAARVKELGAQLTAEYQGKDVIVIALLKGCACHLPNIFSSSSPRKKIKIILLAR